MLFVSLALIALVVLYIYGTKNFDYWLKRGVKHDKPIPIFGNDARGLLAQISMADLAAELYWKYPKERVVGFFRGTRPELLIRDPEIIKQVLNTDFSYFYRRGVAHEKNGIEPLFQNIFFLDGDIWRLLRHRMTPAFTTGKLKAMFPLIVDRAEKLRSRVVEAAATDCVIDARELMARYTTDFIGACGFGLDSDSLVDENSPFRKLGEKIFKTSRIRSLKAILKEVLPLFFKHLKLMGDDVEKEMLSIVCGIQKQRNYMPSNRNDFIDLLLECKKQGKMVCESIEKVNADGEPTIVEAELDEMLMTAQVFIFFAAGFETSSSATSYTLHQLAFNPTVQRKVQDEIDKVLAAHDNKLSYEAVKHMTYLNWTFKEGMRMFPSLGFLLRECARPYTFKDLDLSIDEDVMIMIPLQALHNDPQYFNSPEEFRPERFDPDKYPQANKYVYLPFGTGPRACIGERLGLMQSLAGLAAILSVCSVEPAPTTLRHPLVDPRSRVVQCVKGGLPLLFRKRINKPSTSE